MRARPRAGLAESKQHPQLRTRCQEPGAQQTCGKVEVSVMEIKHKCGREWSVRVNDDGDPVLVVFDYDLFPELRIALSESAWKELVRLGPAIVELPLRAEDERRLLRALAKAREVK